MKAVAAYSGRFQKTEVILGVEGLGGIDAVMMVSRALISSCALTAAAYACSGLSLLRAGAAKCYVAGRECCYGVRRARRGGGMTQ